jgi:Ca2+-binding RTX toxin-like protein
MFGGDGDDELTGYEGVDISLGGAGDDSFGFFLGSFAPSSTLAVTDIVLDFQGAGVEGGDVVDLNFAQVAFGGEIDIRVRSGALLPGAGDGVTQLFYTQRNGDTWLIADENDNGRLDDSDFTVRFEGLHDFTRDDFVRTEFVIAGTAGDDTITGTEDGDRVFAAGGDDRVFGLGGDDELNGGAGNDLLDGGPGGFDNLNGEEGADTLTLATSDIGGVASGGAGDDALFGSDQVFTFSDLKGDAGNDTLNAGAAGANLDGGDGADRLVSGVGDDQMVGGRDEFFSLDGDEDLFVYGAGGWGTDTLFDFEDGADRFDLRGSGLTFEDLVITNEDFQTTITSAQGTIFIFESFGQPVEITAADFIFG